MFVSAALGIKCYDEFLVSFSPSVFIVKRCQNTKQDFFLKEDKNSRPSKTVDCTAAVESCEKDELGMNTSPKIHEQIENHVNLGNT